MVHLSSVCSSLCNIDNESVCTLSDDKVMDTSLKCSTIVSTFKIEEECNRYFGILYSCVPMQYVVNRGLCPSVESKKVAFRLSFAFCSPV